MTPLVIIGAGGHALSCLDVIRSTGLFNVIGYVDKESSGNWEGIPYLGNDEQLEEVFKKCPNFFLGIGQIRDAGVRKRIATRLRSLRANFPNIVSPKAHVGFGVVMHEGTIVMHGAHVGPRSTIGPFNILNSKSLVEHGVTTGEFVHISTAAVINGDVQIGDEVFVGSNSIVRHKLTIPSKAFVQAGEFIGGKHVW
jgi:sugar O-acyltransferase (sialic acid O-acetyltransferase NeuD family)